MWITDFLEKEGIPYQITGGLAAHLHGSLRPVNDIDIELPEEHLQTVYAYAKEHCTFHLGHYQDERWDLQMMTLMYRDQEIDICGCKDVRICDARNGQWRHMPSDLTLCSRIKVANMILPVMNRHDLATYKKMLQGDHQAIDIEALESYKGK